MSFLSQFKPYSFPMLGMVRLPSVVVPPEDKIAVGLKPAATNARYLKQLVWREYQAKRAAGKFDGIEESAVIDRLKFEFDVLQKTGTIDYILLVRDIIVNAKKAGIPVGPGRGSVAGSLTCYLAGITKINSLKHRLNFTRFISEARVKPKIVDGVAYADGRAMCDIDCDFSIERQAEVKAYIDAKYPNRTAKISNITALTGKTALKDVLKVYLEWSDDDAKRVSDMVEAHFGKVEKLEDVLEKNKDYRAWVNADPLHKEAHERALALQGLVTHKGVHASGLFLSYAPLNDTLPVELSTDDEGEVHLTTTYDMDTVAEIGVKFDKLSLKTLDVIEEACRLSGVKIDDIDVNDESIYDYLASNRLYYGLFQIETGLAGDATFKAKPSDIEQLSACSAIARPGSLKYIPDLVEYFATGKFTTLYPPIDELLKDTGNIIIYQESINEICQKVYGLSAVDADEARRAIGKKKREDIKKWEPVLFASGDAKGIPRAVTQTFWDTCNASADYLFCAGHAVSYAYLSAWTVYLKANHRKEFYLATLKYAKKPEIPLIISEARQLGVNILPPHLIKSQDDFCFEGNDIRFGLQHIKGIAGANLGKVGSFKREVTNKFDMFALASSLGLPINVVETLIFCGALDIPGTDRLKLAVEARMFNEFTDREKAEMIPLFAAEFNYDLIALLKGIQDKRDEKGKPYIKESRLATYRRDIKPYWDAYQHNLRNESLTLYMAERALLGFSYSNTLFNLFDQHTEGLIPLNQAMTEVKDAEVSFVAFVTEVKKGVGRESKKPYVRFELSDETGTGRAMLNGDAKIQGCEQFNDGLPEVEDIVIVHGTKAEGDMIFASSVIIQKLPTLPKKTKAKKGQTEQSL